MSATPRITPRAQTDLDEIWDYIAERNPDAADRVIDTILTRVRSLARFPLTGRARDDLRPGLRSSPVSPYVILFRPVDDTVTILRIIHGARDIPAVLADDDS